MKLRTADGVLLHADHRPHARTDVCVVLAHGFTNHTRTPHVRRIGEGLGLHLPVLAYDGRGHGRSGGHSTVGDLEPLDVDVAVGAARQLGYERVVTCGWSLGASNVLRHAGLQGMPVGGHVLRNAPDAVVSVSALSRWYYRDTVPMRRVHYAIERRSGRAFARAVLGTRIWHQDWEVLPLSPAQAVARIAPTPLLLIHGDRDAYFPLEHPQALLEASGGHAELWLEPGMGHAEKATSPELIARIAAHIQKLVPTLETGMTA